MTAPQPTVFRYDQLSDSLAAALRNRILDLKYQWNGASSLSIPYGQWLGVLMTEARTLLNDLLKNQFMPKVLIDLMIRYLVPVDNDIEHLGRGAPGDLCLLDQTPLWRQVDCWPCGDVFKVYTPFSTWDSNHTEGVHINGTRYMVYFKRNEFDSTPWYSAMTKVADRVVLFDLDITAPFSIGKPAACCSIFRIFDGLHYSLHYH